MTDLTESLKTARGKRFVTALKECYAVVAPQLAEAAKALISANGGKLSPVDVGVLSIHFNLRLKHTFDFLEEQQVLPTGTYERLQDRGLKAKDVVQAAKKRIAEQNLD